MMIAVMTLGEALRALQGSKTNREVAVLALSKSKATETQIETFANYFSKVKWDQVPGVGYKKLVLIARGLDVPLSRIVGLVEGEGLWESGNGVRPQTEEDPQKHETSKESSGENTTQEVGNNRAGVGTLSAPKPESAGAPHAQIVTAAEGAVEDPEIRAVFYALGALLLSAASIREGNAIREHEHDADGGSSLRGDHEAPGTPTGVVRHPARIR